MAFLKGEEISGTNKQNICIQGQGELSEVIYAFIDPIGSKSYKIGFYECIYDYF